MTRVFVPGKCSSKFLLILGQRCHWQVAHEWQHQLGKAHQMFLPAASSPWTLICKKGWSQGRSVSLPRLRGSEALSSLVLLEKNERKQIPLHYVFIRPMLGAGRPGSASPALGPALPRSPPQQTAAAGPALLQSPSGYQDGLGGRRSRVGWRWGATPALQVLAGVWVSFCLLGAPQDLMMGN